MESIMRLISLVCLILMVVGGLSLAQIGQEPVPAVVAPAQNGLAVHEWGVFRLHDSVDFANADMKQEWNGLPRFVYGQVPGRDLPQQQSNITVLKPVIYLHSSQACSIDLRVDFPGGMPTVWWPRTTTALRGRQFIDDRDGFGGGHAGVHESETSGGPARECTK
jgi:hypothetical protein